MWYCVDEEAVLAVETQAQRDEKSRKMKGGKASE